MKNSLKSFEELKCWQKCREVRIFIGELIKRFPDKEKFALSDGIRRSSRSITENIAEGFGRFHFGENIQFCRISRGSLFEIIDQLITAHDEGYISVTEYNNGRKLIDSALALLNGYINYLTVAKSKSKKSNQIQEAKADYNIYQRDENI